MTSDPAGFLLGLHYSALQVARSLGRRSIPVYGTDPEAEPLAGFSRYVHRVDAPAGGGELCEYLIGLAHRIGRKLVLYPMSDDYVLFLAAHRDRLSEECLFPLSDPEILIQVVGKATLPVLLARMEIDYPETRVLKKDELPPCSAVDFPCPCVVKPVFKSDWLGNPKVRDFIGKDDRVLLIEDREQLLTAIHVLHHFGDLVLQEHISGGSEEFYYYIGYRSRSGTILRSYIGNKIRTLPNGFGSETLFRSVHRPDLLEVGNRILDQLEYVGPAGIDFKLDRRDGKYKVIEINCRIGINDCFLARHGADLAYIYYLESQGIPVEPVTQYPADVTWCDEFRDFDWMREYPSERPSGWPGWFMQVMHCDTYALMSLRDPAPAIRAAFTRVASKLMG